MVQECVVVKTKAGLHLRPATEFCNKALQYPCKIELIKGVKTANAKSLLSVLACQIKEEEQITIVCDGEEEEKALEAMKELLREGLV